MNMTLIGTGGFWVLTKFTGTGGSYRVRLVCLFCDDSLRFSLIMCILYIDELNRKD